MMGWKEAKHQLGRDDFLLEWFYGNRKPKSYYTALFFSSAASQKSNAVPRRGHNIVMPAQCDASGTMNHPLGAPGTHLCWAAAPPFQAGWELWDTDRGGGAGTVSWKEREGAEPRVTGSRTQRLGLLMLFTPKAIHLWLFLLRRPHRDLLASVLLAVTFMPVNSVQQNGQEKPGLGITKHGKIQPQIHPQSLQLLREGRSPLSHGEALGKSHWERQAPTRQKLRKSSLGSSRKQLRKQLLVDDITIYLLPFWRRQLQQPQSKSPGTVKSSSLYCPWLCAPQLSSCACLPDAKPALLLLPCERQKIIVQGKHPYLLGRIMKRAAVSAALFAWQNTTQNQSQWQINEHPFVS